MSQVSDYLSALHESAHIIAAIEFKCPYGGATIEPNEQDGSFGEAQVGCPLTNWQRGDGPRRPIMERYLTGLYAGAAAVAHYKGLNSSLQDVIQKDLETGEFLLSGDRDKAEAEMRRFNLLPLNCEYTNGTKYENYEERIWRKARRFVAQRFPAIKQLAGELAKRRTLERNEIDRVVGLA